MEKEPNATLGLLELAEQLSGTLQRIKEAEMESRHRMSDNEQQLSEEDA